MPQSEQAPLVIFEYGTGVGLALLGVRLVALLMFLSGCLRSLFRAPAAVNFYLKFTGLYSLWCVPSYALWKCLFNNHI